MVEAEERDPLGQMIKAIEIEPTGRDTFIAFSSAPGQESADGRRRNSPFTTSLLRHMTMPGVEISVMLKEVTADVRRETNNARARSS